MPLRPNNGQRHIEQDKNIVLASWIKKKQQTKGIKKMLLFLLMRLHWPTLLRYLTLPTKESRTLWANGYVFNWDTHLSMFQHLHNSRLPLHGFCTVESSPFFGSSSCRICFTGTLPTLLRHNVLARAEDKARDPTPSSFQPQQSSQQQFQVLLLYDPLTEF